VDKNMVEMVERVGVVLSPIRFWLGLFEKAHQNANHVL
jgi:hypothetical protein